MSTQSKNTTNKPLTIDVDYNRPRSVMEELLASQPQKLTTFRRGQEVEGEVIAISEKEITLDLGGKSEGIITSREIPVDLRSELKIGNKLKVFIHTPENEHGQMILSASMPARTTSIRGGRNQNWQHFTQAQNQKSKLQGKVLEINKGGLIVEAMKTRGFLPNSQVGFELLAKADKGMEGLIGQDLTVSVIEVDSDNNKLIFSQRGPISEEAKAKLEGFKSGQEVAGKIVAVLPFGLVVDVSGAEGLVFISDVSWEKVEDLSKQFSVGQEVEVKVLGLDGELGRLNLSIKHLSEDPFIKLTEKYPVDEVVKGEVISVSGQGVVVKFDEGIEGFLPGSKVSPDANYEAGKPATFLVDSIDARARKVNLAPFVTSTAGLIYK